MTDERLAELRRELTLKGPDDHTERELRELGLELLREVDRLREVNEAWRIVSLDMTGVTQGLVLEVERLRKENAMLNATIYERLDEILLKANQHVI